MPDVTEERTGWRDQGISERHRKYGFDVPAIDIDFVLCEYDHNIPVAIIEHKNEFAKPQKKNMSGLQALKRLGDMANIPSFCVRYASDFSWFKVAPLNRIASKIYPECNNTSGEFLGIELSEIEYVTFLYRLRKSTVPENILEEVKQLRSA